MNTDIRKRIDELKEINGFETDADVIYAIYYFKKARGEIGKIKDFEYVDKNKGSFSSCCSGRRKFKLEDYDIYFIGDGAGKAGNIVTAAATGLVAARDILGKGN